MKLPDLRGRQRGFVFPQPWFGEAREPRALRGEFSRSRAEFDGRFGDGGEIDMRGDVAFAGRIERIVSGPMALKRAQGARVSRGKVILGPGESIIRPDHPAVGERGEKWGEKAGEVRADFGAIGTGGKGERIERGGKLGREGGIRDLKFEI